MSCQAKPAPVGRPYRAQLCVYLKLNDIPVPRLCGPSADEGDKDREFYQIRAVD
jgi:hypothetical protein